MCRPSGLEEASASRTRGKHFSVQHTTKVDGTCHAVFTDLSEGKLHSKVLPGAQATWHANDVTHVWIPEARCKPVLLPPYDRVALYRKRVEQDPAAASTLERIAVAAWMYCEDSVYKMLTYADGEPVLKDVEQLSAQTRECFGLTPAERVVAKTLEAIAEANRIYFINEEGKKVYGTHTVPNTPRLFMIEGKSSIEVTAPGFEPVSKYTFDALTKRVCATVPAGALIFDRRTGQRHVLMDYDPENHIEYEYRFVPGRDYLVTAVRPDEQYHHDRDTYRLELRTLQGTTVATLSTALPGTRGEVSIGSMWLSEHLLVVVPGRPCGRYRTEVEERAPRVRRAAVTLGSRPPRRGLLAVSRLSSPGRGGRPDQDPVLAHAFLVGSRDGDGVALGVDARVVHGRGDGSRRRDETLDLLRFPAAFLKPFGQGMHIPAGTTGERADQVGNHVLLFPARSDSSLKSRRNDSNASNFGLRISRSTPSHRCSGATFNWPPTNSLTSARRYRLSFPPRS